MIYINKQRIYKMLTRWKIYKKMNINFTPGGDGFFCEVCGDTAPDDLCSVCGFCKICCNC